MAQQLKHVIVTATAGQWADMGSTGHPQSFYAALHRAGYHGVFLDCATPGYTEDVSKALIAGLQVQLFQGYWDPMWSSTRAAASRAHSAIQAAQAVDYPTGCTLWLDAEGMPAHMGAQTWLDWVNAWSQPIAGAQYTCGVYLSGHYPVSAHELYANLPYIHHYWQGIAMSEPVAVRGYTVKQTHVNLTVDGITIDADSVFADNLHQLPAAMALVPVSGSGTPHTGTPSTSTTSNPSTSLTLLASEVAALQKTVSGHTQALQQITQALDALVTAAKKMTLP